MDQVNPIEVKIVNYLNNNQFSDLFILSDFYEKMCEWLKLSTKTSEYNKNKRKIQYFLRKMKNKKLIDWRRCGTGVGGKSTFGMSTLNSYATYELWNR